MDLQKKLFTRFLRYLYPYIKEEIVLFVLMILSSIGALATPYMLKVIIDDIFPKGRFHDLMVLLIILVGIYFLQIIFSLISDILSIKVSKKISADIREEVFANILNKDISFFRKSKIGELVFVLINDIDNIQLTISSLVIRFVKNIIILIGVGIMLFILDYKLALISLTFIPLVILLIKFFDPKIKENFKSIQYLEGQLSNYFMERIKNIRVIKNYQTHLFEINSIKKQHNELVSNHSKGTFITGLNTGTSSLLMSLAPVLVLSYGGYQVFHDTMTVGSLIAFIQYLNRLFTPVIEIVNTHNQFSKSVVSMKRVSEYFNMDKTYSEKLEEFCKTDISEIQLQNISLNYDGIDVLKEINLIFNQGKTYILSGNSGSGKSSIISILCGFVKPSNGNILINNELIDKDIYWNNEICLIEKENQLFHDTLLNNIKYGTYESRFKIEEIIKLVQLEDVVKKLEKGLESTISLSGGTLSDGQKQRISIARAINRSPSVFIFDESTASLDARLERKIIQNIRHLFPESIIIIISHRLETFNLADSVFKIHKGKIDQNYTLSAVI